MRAAKENRRPPFTVAATRLMWTSFSTISLSRSSSRCRRSPRCSSLRAIVLSLEVQAGFARGVRQGLDPAMIEVAATVEDHVLDALLDGALGDQRADAGGGVLVRALGLGFAAFQRRGRRERHATLIVNDLG